MAHGLRRRTLGGGPDAVADVLPALVAAGLLRSAVLRPDGAIVETQTGTGTRSPSR